MSNRLNLNEYINVDEVKVTDDSATLIGIDKNGDLAVVPNDFNEIKEDIKTLDEKIDAIDVSVYATKEEVNTVKKDLEAEITASKKEAVSESQKYTDAAKSALNSEISKKADKTYVDSEVKSAKTAAVSESKTYTDTVKKSLNDEIAKKANADSVNSQFSQINSTLNKKADKSEIPTDYVSKKDFDNAIDKKADKSALDGKQDKLVSGTNIKTINGKSILGEGNIVIEGGSGEVVDAYTKEESDNKFATKTELSGYQVKGDYATKEELSNYQPAGDYATKSEIPSLEGYATESYVNDAVSKVEVDAYTKAESDAKYGTKTEQESLRSDVEDVMGEVATLEADKANKSDLDKYATKEEVPTEFKTINGESILGEGNIEIKGGSEPVDAYTKAESDEKFATKGEVPTPQNGNYGSEKNYVYSQPSMSGNKGVLNDINFLPNEDKITIRRKWWNDTSNSYIEYLDAATQSKAGVMSAQDKTKLDNAPTEFKTINGEPIVGSGNIEISGGETIDAYTKTEADNKFATKEYVESEVSGVESNVNSTLQGVIQGIAENVYTKEDADEKFATKTELSGYQVKGDYATKEELNDYQTKGDYVTEEELEGKNYITKDEIPEVPDVSDMLTKTEAAKEYQPIGDYATKEYVETEVNGVESNLNSTIQGVIQGISETVYTKEDVDGKIKEINDELADKVDSTTLNGYATKQELTQSIENKADKTEITQLESEIAGKQDELVSGTNIKTINGASILGEGNIEIKGGGEPVDAYTKAESDAKYGTKTEQESLRSDVEDVMGEVATLEADKADKSELEKYATKQYVEDEVGGVESNLNSTIQGIAQSVTEYTYSKEESDNKFATKEEVPTEFKTINGESILGEGNIEIKGGSGEPVDAYTKAESDEKFATKEELDGKQNELKYKTALMSSILITGSTKSDYQFMSRDLETGALSYIIQPFKTINGEPIVGSGNIEISGGGGSETYIIYNSPTDEEKEKNKEVYQLLEEGKNINIFINLKGAVNNVSNCIGVSAKYSYGTYLIYFTTEPTVYTANYGDFLRTKFDYQYAALNENGNLYTSGDGYGLYLKNTYFKGSLADGNDNALDVKQIDLESVTEKGQGLADSYNVKAYIDSQIGDIDSALDAILNPA